MKRAQAGDKAAFDVLHEKYVRIIGQFCRHILSQRASDIADDVTQDVFVRAWENREKYQPSGPVSAWLRQIARNLCINALKGRALSTVPLESEGRAPEIPDTHKESPEKLALSAELLQTLFSQLKTDADRLYFRLHFQRRMSADEIAKALGHNRETVKSRLQRMKPILRTVLVERGYP